MYHDIFQQHMLYFSHTQFVWIGAVHSRGKGNILIKIFTLVSSNVSLCCLHVEIAKVCLIMPETFWAHSSTWGHCASEIAQCSGLNKLTLGVNSHQARASWPKEIWVLAYFVQQHPVLALQGYIISCRKQLWTWEEMKPERARLVS